MIILLHFYESRFMENNNAPKHLYFYSVGLSYKKADAEVRGQFSLDAVAKTRLLEQAKTEGIESLIVTSTCNRNLRFCRTPFSINKTYLR